MSRLMTIRSFFSNLLGSTAPSNAPTATAASDGFSAQLTALQAPAQATDGTPSAAEPLVRPEAQADAGEPKSPTLTAAARSLTLGEHARNSGDGAIGFSPETDSQGEQASGALPTDAVWAEEVPLEGARPATDLQLGQHAPSEKEPVADVGSPASPAADDPPSRGSAYAGGSEGVGLLSQQQPGGAQIEPAGTDAAQTDGTEAQGGTNVVAGSVALPSTERVEASHSDVDSVRGDSNEGPGPRALVSQAVADEAPRGGSSTPSPTQGAQPTTQLVAPTTMLPGEVQENAPADVSRTPSVGSAAGSEASGTFAGDAVEPSALDKPSAPAAELGKQSHTSPGEALAPRDNAAEPSKTVAPDISEGPGSRSAGRQLTSPAPDKSVMSAGLQGTAESGRRVQATASANAAEDGLSLTSPGPRTAEQLPQPDAPTRSSASHPSPETPSAQAGTTAGPGQTLTAVAVDNGAAVAQPGHEGSAKLGTTPTSNVERLVQNLPEGRLPNPERFTVQQLETALGREVRSAGDAGVRPDASPKQSTVVESRPLAAGIKAPMAEGDALPSLVRTSEQAVSEPQSEARMGPVAMTQDRFFRSRIGTSAPMVFEPDAQGRAPSLRQGGIQDAAVVPSTASQSSSPQGEGVGSRPLLDTQAPPPVSAPKVEAQGLAPEAKASSEVKAEPQADSKPALAARPQSAEGAAAARVGQEQRPAATPTPSARPIAPEAQAVSTDVQPERGTASNQLTVPISRARVGDTLPVQHTPDEVAVPAEAEGAETTVLLADDQKSLQIKTSRPGEAQPARAAEPAAAGERAEVKRPQGPPVQQQNTPAPERLASGMQSPAVAPLEPSEVHSPEEARGADSTPSRSDSSSSSAGVTGMSGSSTGSQGGFEQGSESGQQPFEMEPISALAEDSNALIEPNTVEFEAALRTERAELEAMRVPSEERTMPSGAAARVARTVLAEAWQAQLLRPGNATMRTEDGWQVLRIRLDEDGSLTVRTRQTEQGLSVTVGLSDPALRAQAIAQADRIQQNLQSQLEGPVDFSFQSDGSSSQAGQRDAGAQQGGRTTTPASAGGTERQVGADTPAAGRGLQGQREWVG